MTVSLILFLNGSNAISVNTFEVNFKTVASHDMSAEDNQEISSKQAQLEYWFVNISNGCQNIEELHEHHLQTLYRLSEIPRTQEGEQLLKHHPALRTVFLSSFKTVFFFSPFSEKPPPASLTVALPDIKSLLLLWLYPLLRKTAQFGKTFLIAAYVQHTYMGSRLLLEADRTLYLVLPSSVLTAFWNPVL